MKLSIPKLRIKVVKCDYVKANVVPKRFRHFLVDMNNYLAFNDTDVYRKREKEVNRIFNCLLKTRNPNVVLLGEHGVGKSSVVSSAIHYVLNKKCPKQLRDNHFIYWDIEKTLAVLSSEDDNLKQKLVEAFQFITSASNLIVVIDQVHLMATSHTLIYYFSILLKSNNVKLIGITTEEDFEGFFSNQTKILSLIETITIHEPRSKEIYPMICDYVGVLSKRHNVAISEDMVNYTVSVLTTISSQIANPGLALDVIEKSMIVAKRRKHTEVYRKDVNYNLNFDYDLYEKMPMIEKMITTYHEIGHAIVAKGSENINNYEIIAITCVPVEGALGQTMFEPKPEKQTSFDADYFKDSIAVHLGGRAAESILQKRLGEEVKFTSGAFCDLKNATQTARDIATEYGMVESVGQNMTYFCNYDISDLALLSEDTKKEIDKATKRLISEAYERANKILNKNLDLLDQMAHELLVNEVLVEKDLDRFFNQIKKTE